MDREYAHTDGATFANAAAGQKLAYAGDSIRKETALDRLADHANAAARVGDIIQNFLDRCRGGGECSNDIGQSKLGPAPTGHFYQIDRLEKNLARAEELARELGSIG